MQLFVQMPDIDTLKIFRMQQRLLDAMLQCVKIFCVNLCTQELQHGIFKGVALKLFQASMSAVNGEFQV